MKGIIIWKNYWSYIKEKLKQKIKKLEGDLARGKNAKAGSFLDLDKSGDI